MSSKVWIALRLQGPLQSWGFESRHSYRRSTASMPTKSAIAGMCCAANGFHRGSELEREFLIQFSATHMLSLSIPRTVGDKRLESNRLRDYHIVSNTLTAEGKVKEYHPTHRDYLTDTSFGIVLGGNHDLLQSIAKALIDPVWGIWFGRKACIPTAPVLIIVDGQSIFHTQDAAVASLIGDEPITSFTRQEDVESFGDGRDSLMDQAVCFGSNCRSYSMRRVRTEHGTG